MYSFRSRIFAIIVKSGFVFWLLYLLAIRYRLFEIFGPYYAVLITTIKFIAFIIALDILNDLLKYFYRKRVGLRQNQHDNITLGLNNIYILLVIGSTIVTIIAYFGLNPKELFTSLSIVAAAIAIISRDYIVDIVSGMIIAFSREVIIDDYVQIGNHKGRVKDIGLYKIAMINDDDDLVFLPNHFFVVKDIVNYSRRTVRRTVFEFEMEYSHFGTMEALEMHLINCLNHYKEYVEIESVKIKIIEIHKEHIQLKIQYNLTVADRQIEKTIRKDVKKAIVEYVHHVIQQGSN